MDAVSIDEDIKIAEAWIVENAPQFVYRAWSTVADAADRYAGLLD